MVSGIRTLFRRLTVFILLLLVVVMAADFVISKVSERVCSPNMEIWADVMKGRVDASLVILGNSRANLNVIPAFLDSLLGTRSYNLGVIGHPISAQTIRYKTYRQRNPKPEYVIQILDDLAIVSYNSDYDLVQLCPWFYYKGFAKEVPVLGKKITLSLCVPLFRYRSFRPWEQKFNPPTTEKGFYNYDSDSLVRTKENRIFKRNEFSLSLLREQTCGMLGEGIRVVFVVPPVYKTYPLAKEDRDAMLDCFNELASSLGVPLLDYGALWVSEDSTLFNDDGHLNRLGAGIFTESLATGLERINFFEKN